jgi:hypothetical protein
MSEKIEHTAGEWQPKPADAQCGNDCTVDQPYRPYIYCPEVLCGGCGRTRPAVRYDRWKPGDLNRRKLELFDEALAAIQAIEPYLATRAEVLDGASLNEGRASGYGVASLALREVLAKAKELK